MHAYSVLHLHIYTHACAYILQASTSCGYPTVHAKDHCRYLHSATSLYHVHGGKYIYYVYVVCIIWISPDFHLTFTWLLHDFHMIITWQCLWLWNGDFMFFCPAAKFPLHPLCSLLWERPAMFWAGLRRREGVVCIGRLSPSRDSLQQTPTWETGAKLRRLSPGCELCHSPQHPPSLSVSAQHNVPILGCWIWPPASLYIPGDHSEVRGEAICAQLCQLPPWLLGVWAGEWPYYI